MFTSRAQKRTCLIACLVVAGCASQGRQVAHSDSNLNLGTTPTSTELARFFSYPADGRGLPAGSGSYAEGEKVYSMKCVACHGQKLEGTRIGDKLIGGRGTLVNNDPAKRPIKTVESYWPYATTLFDYVKRAMPLDAPGSLTDEEVYQVVAYILAEAHIVAKNEVIDASNLPKVQMPNRNGFVSPDPRPDVP